MSNLMNLAQAASPPPFWAGLYLPVLLTFGILYFLMIRPERQKEKRRKEMIAALKVGDKVLLSSGILGVVAQAGERTIKLKVADNVKIEVLRSAVTGLQEEPAAGAEKGKD